MLKTGDKVKVFIPSNEQSVSKAISEFNGTITFVKKRKVYRKNSSQYNFYTLDDCTSKFGNDYEFSEEWLIPLG